MHCKTASTSCYTGNTGNNAREAVRKLRGDFSGFNAGTVVYFCSTAYDPDVMAAEMADAFPTAVTMGCTSAGEGVNGRIMNGSVVAMAFSPEVFSYCETALVLSARDRAIRARRSDVFHSSTDAVRYLSRNVGHDLRGTRQREYVGFLLGDAGSDFVEGVIERFGDLNDVMLIGGIAGDDYKYNDSHRIMYQGKAYKDGAAVLALWKPARGFSLLKTQAVDLTDKTVVVTRSEEINNRNIIWEMDGQDAAAVYARLMGVPPETMDVLDYDEHPLASTADGDPYVRAVRGKVNEKGLWVSSRVREGTRLTLTNAGDILATTREALAAKRLEMGTVSAIVQINCVSRHTALRKWGQIDQYAALFGDVPSISVSSYGEVYVGLVAMTSTMLLFK